MNTLTLDGILTCELMNMYNRHIDTQNTHDIIPCLHTKHNI